MARIVPLTSDPSAYDPTGIIGSFAVHQAFPGRGGLRRWCWRLPRWPTPRCWSPSGSSDQPETRFGDVRAGQALSGFSDGADGDPVEEPDSKQELSRATQQRTVLLEVASIRIPCNEFKGWMGECGYDRTAWVKRFTATNRPGPYLRVVEEGVVRAGDAIDVVHRPGHGVTVSTMFRALTTERTLLPELLRVGGLVEEARVAAEKYVANQA